jgi:general stress protein 26
MFALCSYAERFATTIATAAFVWNPAASAPFCKEISKEPIMSDDRQRDEELKQQFWEALDDSPFLFLQLDSDPDTAVPMTAALDEEANGAIWFFTGRDHVFARGGPATATFAGKGHGVFARFKGALVHETSRDRLDKEWSNFVEAYFPRGKDDPSLLLLRMDLADAEIWTTDVGLTTTIKMALGRDVREETREQHAETAL